MTATNLLTARQLAERLGITLPALYQRVSRGLIPERTIVRVGPRTLRFSPGEVDAWLERLRGK